MLTLKLVHILLLATVIAATVLPQPLPKSTGTLYNDTFDDLATSVATPELYAVGRYHDIAYKGATVTRANNVTTGLTPHSGAQFAVSTIVVDVLQLGTLALNSFLILSPGSAITTFDLLSFYWGLELSAVGADPVAEAGTIYVVGYDTSGKQLVRSFSFVPTQPTGAPMVQAVLPDFKYLKNVTIAISSSEFPPERTNLVVDDLIHVNHP